eukprot:NODE_2120_length_508_cov_10.882353_g1731_i0.p2 GENE.NODE_2120_length_508_cov_10.882353_g1731_i0~~NODE_2120_length_508_cov_10.882353_g1731_i0.p2  ORF type:complete len:83 (+),score=7.40 NODE_2120_length_508_cov_10.882353_g1731_i0:102-350(+)
MVLIKFLQTQKQTIIGFMQMHTGVLLVAEHPFYFDIDFLCIKRQLQRQDASAILWLTVGPKQMHSALRIIQYLTIKRCAIGQ